MRRRRPAPRHRGDPRPHSGVGEQLALCVLAVQLALGWMPSSEGDRERDPAPAAQAAVHGPPAIPLAAQFGPPAVVDDDLTASVTRLARVRVKEERVAAVSTVSTDGIPDAALAAYQRAAAVLASDQGCHLDWQLLAAIGRAESDHGRYGGNILTRQGVSRPGIFGIALDGARHTAVIRDTDAGLFDGDRRYDRAVGPMQFIPSTWAVVGVDADGDGTRNPQDIDDAALAAAVYLCSGADDLSTEAGRRQAVWRYNHSQSYVDLVLALRDAYLAGDFTAVPTPFTGPVPARQVVDTEVVVQARAKPRAVKPARPANELNELVATAAEALGPVAPTWPVPNPDPADPEPGQESPPECATVAAPEGDPVMTGDEVYVDSAASQPTAEAEEQAGPEGETDEDDSSVPDEPVGEPQCTAPSAQVNPRARVRQPRPARPPRPRAPR